MSEKMIPEEVTYLMNGCFKMTGKIVEGYGGLIDKFIGDCVMVMSCSINPPYFQPIRI
jgi:class 3 adenylate cyclase